MATETLNAGALTTLARVQREVDDDSPEQRDYLIDLINTYSEAVEDYLNRRLGHDAAIVEDVAGYGGVHLMVSRAPVWSVASVEYTGGLALSTPIDVAEVRIDQKAGILERRNGWPNTAARDGRTIAQDLIPGTEERAIRITYAGGWVLPNDADVAGVDRLPRAIERACQLAVTTAFGRRARPRDIRNERAEGYSVSLAQVDTGALESAETHGLPPESILLLRRYRLDAGDATP